MKKIIFIMVAMMVTTMSYGQNKLLAKLTHGSKIGLLYGIYDIKYSHKVANDKYIFAFYENGLPMP